MQNMLLDDEEVAFILKRRAQAFNKKNKTCSWCSKIVKINFNNSILEYVYCPFCGKVLGSKK